jgi:hypothetical protein
MIIGFIANLLAYVMKPKRAAWVARGLVLLVIAGALYAAYCWAYDNGKDTERAKWEAAAEHLEEADAAADAEAIDVAHDMKGQVDAVTEQARDDARQSDDPLDAVAKRLREEGARGSR